MTEVAKLIADMVRAGVDPDLIGRAAAAIADSAAPAAPVRTARQERNARYYASKASEKRLNASEQDVSDDAQVSPKKETSPAPLKEKTTPSTTEPNGSSKTRASRLPADWALPVEWRADAIKAGLPQDRIDLEAEKMRDWSISSPNGAKREWRSAWRNWVKGAVDKLPNARGSPPRQPQPRYDPYKALAEEYDDGQDRSERSDNRDWDDAQGVPFLTIEHH